MFLNLKGCISFSKRVYVELNRKKPVRIIGMGKAVFYN
jgi:hypothetical protein